MIKENQRFFNQINLLLTALIALCAMLLGYWIRFVLLTGAVDTYGLATYVWLGLLSAVLHLPIYAAFGLYESQRRQATRTALLRIFASELICSLITLSALYILDLPHVSRGVIFIAFGISLCAACAKYLAVRAVLQYYRRQGKNQKHVVLIGGGRGAHGYRRMLKAHPEYGFTVAGYFAPEADWPSQKWLGTYAEVEKRLKTLSPDEAIIALSAEDYIYITDIITACERTGTYLRIIPCYDEYISSRMRVETLDGINVVDIRSVPLTLTGNAIVKRGVDILVSSLALVVFSPLMLVAVIGIKLTSPGPILFRQERVGKNKKHFAMLKFRSMHVNDSETTGWTRDEDSRKTRFGAVMRKLSIDELPQFLNVLRGEMSVVGPRPEIPYHVERLSQTVPLYMIKHYVKPGITGWAQVNGYRGDTSIPKRIEHDIFYIENWSLWLDLKIMLLTVFRMVNAEKVAGGDGP